MGIRGPFDACMRKDKDEHASISVHLHLGAVVAGKSRV